MDRIEGQIITDVRSLAGSAPEGFSWAVSVYEDSLVLELGDGSLLIPVRDLEGNGPGAWNGKAVDDWDNLTGSIIDSISPMTPEAMEYRGWGNQSEYQPPVLSLNTGEKVFPVADPEGTQKGVLYRVQHGETFLVAFERQNE